MSTHADSAKSQPGGQSRLKALGLILGAGAVLAAVSFTVAHPDSTDGGGSGFVVAGNPTYAPPAVPGMNMGGTVTQTTPSTVLPVEKAVPEIKAGH